MKVQRPTDLDLTASNSTHKASRVLGLTLGHRLRISIGPRTEALDVLQGALKERLVATPLGLGALPSTLLRSPHDSS